MHPQLNKFIKIGWTIVSFALVAMSGYVYYSEEKIVDFWSLIAITGSFIVTGLVVLPRNN